MHHTGADAPDNAILFSRLLGVLAELIFRIVSTALVLGRNAGSPEIDERIVDESASRNGGIE